MDAAALPAELDTSYLRLWPLWWDGTGHSVYDGPERLPEQTAAEEQLAENDTASPTSR